MLNENKDHVQQLAAIYTDALHFQDSYALNPVSFANQETLDTDRFTFD